MATDGNDLVSNQDLLRERSGAARLHATDKDAVPILWGPQQYPEIAGAAENPNHVVNSVGLRR